MSSATSERLRYAVGQRFGRLQIVRLEAKFRAWCRCDCGNEKSVTRHNLGGGQIQSCGCLRSERLRERHRQRAEASAIPPGTRFGRLVVKEVDRIYVVCACDCGVVKRILKYDLSRQRTTSCGCFSKEVSADNMRRTATKHGRFGTKEHRAWASMISRCTQPSDASYRHYGARGMIVTRDWLGPDGFVRFLRHIGPSPSEKHSIDRVDNARGYEEGNVRWATATEQARNRRDNNIVTAFGRTQALSAWADEMNILASTLSNRLHAGWPPDLALTTPRHVRNRLCQNKDGHTVVRRV